MSGGGPEQGADLQPLGQQPGDPEDRPGEHRCAERRGQDAQLRLGQQGAVEGQRGDEQGHGKADPRDRARARDGGPADRRLDAAPAEPGDEPRRAGGAHRLAHHVADQDAQRDRGRVGPGEQPHVDHHPGVGQGEQRHDEIARPRVVQLLEPLVGGDGQGDAVPGLARQLGGGLLTEQPEQVAGPFQVAARRGAGVGEQAHDQPHHHRVHAGLEERHPGGRAEQEVARPEPHARSPDARHRDQDADPRQQRRHLQPRAVKNRDNGQSGQIIHDGEGEQVGAHPVGQPGTDQRQHSECERGVGGHGRAPAPGSRATRVGGEVDGDGDDHSAQADQQRQRQPPPLAQFAHVELAPRLQADDQEEERHQAGVHPAVQVVGQARAADVHRQPGGPERFVGSRRDVRPDQRADRGGQEDRRAARLRAEELAQRGLQVPRPRGPPGQG